MSFLHINDATNADNCATSQSDLAALAEHADAIRTLGRRVTADVAEMGGRLKVCRRILKDDGRYHVWLDSELRLSPQTAGRFIQVHELLQQHSNLECTDLPVSAIYELAAPSCPLDVRETIVNLAVSGEKLTHAQVKATVVGAKRALGHVPKGAGVAHNPPARTPELTSLSWTGASLPERTRFLDGVGLATLRAAIPKSWGLALCTETSADGNVGIAIAGENERLRVRNEELESLARRLERENLALESQVEELTAELAKVPAALQAVPAAALLAEIERRLPANVPQKVRTALTTLQNAFEFPGRYIKPLRPEAELQVEPVTENEVTRH